MDREAPLSADPTDDAFLGRYERLAPALWLWASRHASTTLRARVEIDDVIQEVWLRAYRIRDAFRGDDREFRAWIFRIAKLVLLESHRSAVRLRRLGQGDGATAHRLGLEAVPDPVTRLSQRLAREEGLARLLAHLATLEPEDQELACCCGLEGATCAEAARRLGIAEAAAIKRWQRLRARLREHERADVWLT